MNSELSKVAKACTTALCFCAYGALADIGLDSDEELLSLSLEDLLNITVSSASGINESYRDAPAAMVIITAAEIKKRGYASLDELLLDLPGFDNSVTNGNGSLTTYQRGYKTPFTQRTLLLINGIVDNHLWTHEATFTKTYPLSNIDKIEVLYGPAGAVYGPNAFLGIMNVITKDAKAIASGEDRFDVNLYSGSYDTQSIDMAAAGHFDEFSYSFSAKYYSSDEPGIDDYAPWGFLNAEMLASQDIWGPVVYDTNLTGNCDQAGCPHESKNEPYGRYHDRTRDWGILADVGYKNFKAGIIMWEMSEGYGPYYPSDRAQPGSFWNRGSNQYYVEHKKKIRDDLSVKTRGSYRESRVWGDWAEAVPGSSALSGPDALSWLSISDWNSISNSWLFKQDYEYQYNDSLHISGGLKYESKELTKAYDVCSYWGDSFCSSASAETAGDGIALNTDMTLNIQPDTLTNMPDENLATTTDKGVYLQGIWSLDKWRINAGIRYDKNSLYGSTVNPRASAVYYISEKATAKLLYGTAFQEPAPIQLWGGWSGRAANPDLRPEDAQNLEFIFMYQQANWLHDVSVFAAHYEDVIKEEAENAGERNTFGVEYRGKYQFANPISGAGDVTGYLYYTYTKTKSSVSYDHAIGQWVGQGIASCGAVNQDYDLSYDACKDMNVELGDIAPHKVNVGVNWPLSKRWNLNVRANWVASKKLYVRNPLRDKGRENQAYTVVDANLTYDFAPFSLSFKVRNLFDETYYHSGVEGAESGDDFTQRSLGWRNSLIPQAGRSFMVRLSMTF